MEDSLSIRNTTKGKLPSLPFAQIKKDILGKDYSLSIAFISPKKSAELNTLYRGKAGPTNILSFTLSKNAGEIVLCPALIKKETEKFDRTFRSLLGFLVIHGMLHLKGFEHGAKMERAEKKYDQKYFSRN